MDGRITTLERAFELAKSGTCESVADIKKHLKVEGYTLAQIEGRTLSKQLMALIKLAKTQTDA